MFDVYFEYFDGNSYFCNNISRISVSTSGGLKDISGDDIMNYHYRLYSEMYLYSSDSCYTVSCNNLKSIRVVKK